MNNNKSEKELMVEILAELKIMNKYLYQLTEDSWRIKMTVYGDR